MILDTATDDNKDVDERAFHKLTRDQVKEKIGLGPFNSGNIMMIIKIKVIVATIKVYHWLIT